MEKKITLKSAGLIAIAASLLTFSFTTFFAFKVCNDSVADLRNMAGDINKLYEVKDCINKTFYSDIDDEKVTDAALKAMVSALDDPYSAYMTQEEYDQSIENAKGHISGIGITVKRTDENTLKVVYVNDDSPAMENEIEIDDEIIAVDGEDITQVEYQDAVNMVRGDVGTDVRLKIRRNDEEFELTLTRTMINMETVTWTMIPDNIAYIRISSFKETTQSQYSDALSEALEQNAKGIIFDLRNNGGGLVAACEACLDPLLPEGEVATANYKNGNVEVICHSDAEELDLPMVVLVNEKTASAAELFSSALRDFGKAELVGENTFGKGIMQDTVYLKNGGGLRLTVATYKTTKSECYHGVGLKPDHEVALPEKFKGMDIKDIPKEEDPQLSKAREILKK